MRELVEEYICTMGIEVKSAEQSQPQASTTLHMHWTTYLVLTRSLAIRAANSS